jgi:hypothetical protein
MVHIPKVLQGVGSEVNTVVNASKQLRVVAETFIHSYKIIFLGSVAYPDPYVFGSPGSGSASVTQRYGSSKNNKKNLDSYCFVTSV